MLSWLGSRGRRRPDLSVVVVAHDIPRELPRTLRSLAADCQRWVAPAEYEVIVVDNGSNPPVDGGALDRLPGRFRLLRVDPAPPSPAHAANRGIAAARGEVIGLMIDGARLATPGLLHFARHGARLHDRAVVASLGWHLGHDLQSSAIQAGYDARREDDLLASIGWPEDGYRLFEIGTMDESSVDGWFTPIAESNALFLRREAWQELGGLDERFDAPGGGLVNLDLFRRALERDRAELVILLGEATFHQVHGGVSTNARPEQHPENWARWAAQYERIRGEPYRLPVRTPTYLGVLPRAPLSRFTRAAVAPVALGRLEQPPLGPDFDPAVWGPQEAPRAQDATAAAVVALVREEFASGRYAAAAAVARLMATRGLHEPEAGRLLGLAAPWLSMRWPVGAEEAGCEAALERARRLLGDEPAAGRRAAAERAARSDPGPADELDPLTRLAIRHGTDKWGPHFYTPVYHEILRHLRTRPVRLLEIGVGGYGWRRAGGRSLAMWADYFVHGTVVGVDVAEKDLDLGPRVLLRRGSQTDAVFLERLCDELGPFDVVVDDGSHRPADAVRTFELLFPRLSETGLYLVEDVQTAFWSDYGGSAPDGGPLGGLVALLLGWVNHAEIAVAAPGVPVPALAHHVRSVRLFHNLLVVERGDNTDPSNFDYRLDAPSAAHAVASMEREMEREPTAAGLANLALLLRAAGERERARRHLLAGLERWPDDPDLLTAALDVHREREARLAALGRLAALEGPATEPLIERVRSCIERGESTMTAVALWSEGTDSGHP